MPATIPTTSRRFRSPRPRGGWHPPWRAEGATGRSDRALGAPLQAEPAGDGAPFPTTVRRVLVVDDEPAMRTLCRVNLVASGMEVLEAPDGQAALAVAAAELPDLVLLDVMLPGLSGWEVASTLGEQPETEHIPIVFLSARADYADLVRGQEAGAVGYVTKPFDPVGIADIVEQTIQRVARGEREQLRAEITEYR